MILVDGKEVFSELEDLVDPAYTALLLTDVQVDFVDRRPVRVLGIGLSMYDATRPLLAATRRRRSGSTGGCMSRPSETARPCAALSRGRQDRRSSRSWRRRPTTWWNPSTDRAALGKPASSWCCAVTGSRRWSWAGAPQKGAWSRLRAGSADVAAVWRSDLQSCEEGLWAS